MKVNWILNLNETLKLLHQSIMWNLFKGEKKNFLPEKKNIKREEKKAQRVIVVTSSRKCSVMICLIVHNYEAVTHFKDDLWSFPLKV